MSQAFFSVVSSLSHMNAAEHALQALREEVSKLELRVKELSEENRDLREICDEYHIPCKELLAARHHRRYFDNLIVEHPLGTAKLGMFEGEVSLLHHLTDFVAESDSLHSQKVQRVWRTLSRDNKKTVDGADGVLKTVNLSSCRNLTDAAAQHLAQCPQLQTVNFERCENLTNAAAQHLAGCRQLQTVSFHGCGNLTIAAAQHLARCPRLQNVILGL